MKKKKERITASGFFWIYGLIIHLEIFGQRRFGSEQIDKVKNANEYALAPEYPDDGSVFSGIIFVLINKKDIQT